MVQPANRLNGVDVDLVPLIPLESSDPKPPRHQLIPSINPADLCGRICRVTYQKILHEFDECGHIIVTVTGQRGQIYEMKVIQRDKFS